jgi:hypothetical protein
MLKETDDAHQLLKEVYQTRYDSGVYVGITHARRDPEQPDRWAIPGACVEVAPPPIPEGGRARWLDGAWIIEAPPPAPEKKGFKAIWLPDEWAWHLEPAPDHEGDLADADILPI